MTPEQRLHELRKALAIDTRLAQLLSEVAADYAGAALRKLYTTNDPGILIRQSGIAEGAELFAKEITKAPVRAPNEDRRE